MPSTTTTWITENAASGQNTPGSGFSNNAYKSSNRNYTFYASSVDTWFGFFYTHDINSTPGTYNQGSLGWRLMWHSSDDNAPHGDIVTGNASWHDTNIDFSSQSGYITNPIWAVTGDDGQLKRAFMPSNGLSPENDPLFTAEYINTYNQMQTNTYNFHSDCNQNHDNQHQFTGLQMDIAWDDVTNTLHMLNWDGVHVLYSKYRLSIVGEGGMNYGYNHGTFTKIDLSEEYPLTEFYSQIPANWSSYYSTEPQMLPRTLSHLPGSILVSTGVPIKYLDAPYVSACKLYTNSDATDPLNPANTQFDENLEHLDFTYNWNCSIMLNTSGKVIISVDGAGLFIANNNKGTGRALFYLGNDGRFSLPLYTSPQQLSVNTHNAQNVEGYNRCPNITEVQGFTQENQYNDNLITIDQSEASGTPQFTVWHQTNDISGSQIGNYVDVDNISNQELFQITFFIDQQAAYPTYLGPNPQCRYAYGPSYDTPYFTYFNTFHIPGVITGYIFNYALVNSDGTFDWYMPDIQIWATTDADTGAVSYIQKSGSDDSITEWPDHWGLGPSFPFTHGASPYFKFISNINAGNLVFYLLNEEGELRKKVIPLERLENNDLHEAIPEIQAEYVVGNGHNDTNINMTSTIVANDYISPSEDSTFLLTASDNHANLYLMQNIVEYAPGAGSVYDYRVKELRAASAVMGFSLLAEDAAQLEKIRYVIGTSSIFASDFYTPQATEVLYEGLQKEEIYAEDGETLYKIEFTFTIRQLIPGSFYYTAIQPILAEGLEAPISNQTSLTLPNTSVNTSSNLLTVPMQNANGALYVGTGSGTDDKPQHITRITHSQFATNYNSIHISDAECISPTGDTQITAFDNLISLQDNLSPALTNYQLGYSVGESVLFLIHKETGQVRKTNAIGINIHAVANSVSRPGIVWVYEKQSNHIHQVNIDPATLNTTYVASSHLIEYTPKFMRVNETENLETWRGWDTAAPVDGNDFAGWNGTSYNIANIIEVGNTLNSKLIIMADTEGGLVKPGYTCFLGVNPSSSTWVWEDCMFPWNPTFCSEWDEVEGEGDTSTYNEVGIYNSNDGVWHTSGLSPETRGIVWDEDSGLFTPNPKGSGFDTRNPVVEALGDPYYPKNQSLRAELTSLSYNHGPHKRFPNDDWGFIPLKHTLVIHNNGADAKDQHIGFYAEFKNIKYKHAYTSVDAKQLDGHTGNYYDSDVHTNGYQSELETDVTNLVYVKMSAHNKGWMNPYFAIDANDQGDQDYNEATFGNFKYWDCANFANHYIGKDSNDESGSFQEVNRNDTQFECLLAPSVSFYQSYWNNSHGDLKDINNAVKSHSYNNGINTSIIAVEQNLSETFEVTAFIKQELAELTKDPWDNLTWDTAHSPCYAILKPLRVSGTRAAGSSATDTPYGKITLDFGGSNYAFFNDGIANVGDTVSAGAVHGIRQPNRNVALHIRNIETPFICGDTNIGNTLTIRFWETATLGALTGHINYDTQSGGGANPNYNATTDVPRALGATTDYNLYDYAASNTGDSGSADTDFHDTYLGQSGLVEEKGYTENTLIVNRSVIQDDGDSSTAGHAPGHASNSCTPTQIRDNVLKAYTYASTRTASNRTGNPFIKMVANGTTKIDVIFLYPQSAGVEIVYDNMGSQLGECEYASGNTISQARPWVSGGNPQDGYGPAQIVMTEDKPAQIDTTNYYHQVLDVSTYKDALIAASTNNVGESHVENGHGGSEAADEEYRIISRQGDIVFGKLLSHVNQKVGTPWYSQEQHFHDTKLALGEEITKAPGSLSITGSSLGDYHKGNCVGDDTHDDDEDQCVLVDGAYFSRTGSAKFDPGKRYYYRMSYTYDGFQESPLGQTSWEFDMNQAPTEGKKQGYNSLKLKIKLKNVSKRVTHVTVWRKDDDDEAFYRQVEQVSLAGGWLYDGQNYVKEIVDTGKEGPSYEALTGLSSTIASSSLHYEMSAVSNNMMYVARASIKETGESYPNFLFRSQPGNYSVFNWPNDYCKLPNIPTAIAAMTNKFFAWDANKMYVIDPVQMFVRETYEGIGCLGKESVIVSETGMFWFDKNNIYLLPRTGGIDYVGNKILTSEHGVGWQEVGATWPFKAIFDSKRKAFGMAQMYAPNTPYNRFYMKEGTDDEALVITSGSGDFGVLSGSIEGAYVYPTVNADVLYDLAINNKLFPQIRSLETDILSKSRTKKDKTRIVKNFIAKNPKLIKQLKAGFIGETSDIAVVLGTIACTRKKLKKANVRVSGK